MAALLAGKELGDLTRIVPGPTSALAFLDKIIHFTGSKPPALVRIKDAVNQTAADWRKKFVTERLVPELESVTPVTLAIKQAASLPEGDAWLPAFTDGGKSCCHAIEEKSHK